MKAFLKCFGIIIFFVISLLSCKPAQISRLEINLNNIKDGTYEGYAKHINTAKVSITIKNGVITELSILSLDATAIGQKAKNEIPKRIIQMQTPYVDAVTGATEASNTIINAVVDALSKSIKIE